MQRHAAGLDARHVEDVVDDAEQVGAAGVDVLAVFQVFRRAQFAEHARLHDFREADDGVERRAQLVADIGQELGLGAVGLLGAVLLLGVFLGEVDHLLRLLFQLLARLAEVGDGRHQPALAFDQLAFMALELGDVGTHRHEAAVLGPPFVDLQPAAVLELQLEAAGAGFWNVVGNHLRAHHRLAPGGDDIGVGRARRQHDVGDAVQLLVLGIAHDETVFRVPQDEGLGDRLDGIAQTDVGGLRALDQAHLLGDVDGDADQVRFRAVAVDQLGAHPQPDPAAVDVMHAEHAVDRGFAGLEQGFDQRQQVAVVGVDQPGDLAEAEQSVARVETDDLEHRARPEDAGAGQVPVPQAAAAAGERCLEARLRLAVDAVGLRRARRLREIAVEDDQQDGAGADEDGDVERDVAAPRPVDAGQRLEHGDGPEGRGEVVQRGEGLFAIRQRHLEDAGALAEGGEQLGVADGAVERLVLQRQVARRGGDDGAAGVGDEDLAAVAGGVGGQGVGQRVERVGTRRLVAGGGIGVGEDAHDHADRLARVGLAVDAQLVELDEARQADDQQEDGDEDGNEPAKERFGGQELTVGGTSEQSRVARKSRAPRSSAG